MINPQGQFYNTTTGRHVYSSRIWAVGGETAVFILGSKVIVQVKEVRRIITQLTHALTYGYLVNIAFCSHARVELLK